jgi:hypothetical protein
LGTAAYEYRELAAIDLAANAQQGGTKLTSQDKETAQFNLMMGRVNLVLAAVDVGLSVKAMTGLMKGARSAEQMSTFTKAMKAQEAGQAEEALSTLKTLRKELGEENYKELEKVLSRSGALSKADALNQRIAGGKVPLGIWKADEKLAQQFGIKEGDFLSPQHIEKLHAGLWSRQDINQVRGTLNKLGVEVNSQSLELIKKYNFDSAGIAFDQANYKAWSRLSRGVGTIDDARYIIHEQAEIQALQKVQLETGFDFMGKKYNQLTRKQKETWDADFSRHFEKAHKHALNQEYNFLTKEIQNLTNGEVRLSIPQAAAADLDRAGIPNKNIKETHQDLEIDGYSLGEHPSYAKWRQAGKEKISISSSKVRERLKLPSTGDIRLEELIRAVKAYRP